MQQQIVTCFRDVDIYIIAASNTSLIKSRRCSGTEFNINVI